MPRRFTRFSTLVAVLAVLLTACGHSGSGDGDANGGANGNGEPTASATCSEYVRAMCDWRLRCDTTKTLTLDLCLSQYAHTCEFFALPGVTVAGSDFAACASKYAHDACRFPVFAPDLISAYGPCGFPAGTATRTCAFDLQCTTRLCAKSNGACGSCAYVPKQKLGGQCSQRSDCEDPADCVAAVCTAQRKLGESCSGEQTCVGRSGDAYVACIGGTCTAGGRANESCLDAGGLQYCVSGYACSAQKICVPFPIVGPGEHCGEFADRIAVCRSGVCNAENDPENSACVSLPGIGESCKKVTDYEQCAEGMYCDSALGTCALLTPAGPPENCVY